MVTAKPPAGQQVTRKSNPISSAFAKFRWAIKMQESGGNYRAVSSAGALGAYQIMPGNIPSWSKSALGFSITPQQFLNNPHWQDQIATFQLRKYFNAYGPRGAAAAWYSGQPNPNARFGNPPVYAYVNQVMARMGRAPNNLGSGGSTQAGGSGGGAGGASGAQAQTTGFDPFGIFGQLTGATLGYGIEYGLTTTFEDIMKTWWKRIKWMLYIYVGAVGMLTTIFVAVVWWLFNKAMDNKGAIAAVAAAPETGGASLLMGAAGALRQGRQERAEERSSARLSLAQQRAASRSTEAQQRIELAGRRVAVQETRESRLGGSSGGPPIPAATRETGATAAGNRATQLANERRRLIAQGITDPEEIRKRLRNLP